VNDLLRRKKIMGCCCSCGGQKPEDVKDEKKCTDKPVESEDPKVEEAKELKEATVEAVIEGTMFPQE